MAAEATQAAEQARAALAANTKELAAAEERLRVANDGSLEQQMAVSASEEAMEQLRAALAANPQSVSAAVRQNRRSCLMGPAALSTRSRVHSQDK